MWMYCFVNRLTKKDAEIIEQAGHVYKDGAIKPVRLSHGQTAAELKKLLAGCDRVSFSNFGLDVTTPGDTHDQQEVQETLLFFPLLLSDVLRDTEPQKTLVYLTQDHVWASSDTSGSVVDMVYQTIVQNVKKILLARKDGVLYLDLGMVMTEDLSNNENMLHKMMYEPFLFDTEGSYHISVMKDVSVAIVGLIQQEKRGYYHVVNPTPISFRTCIALCRDHLAYKFSSEDDFLVVRTHETDSSISRGRLYKSQDQRKEDGQKIEDLFFLLPSYQAVQRLLKRIRKHDIIGSKVLLDDVNQKTVIMVTGGYGFIGSNLIHYLYHQYPKCIIINIDRLDYCSRRENLDDLVSSERVISYELDLCCRNEVEDVLRKHNVEYIFHLAAQSHVDNSFNNSLQFSIDNVFGTHSLLQASTNYGRIRRFVHVSTDEVYGETLRKTPFDENELPNPTNPYAATKVGAESIARSYYNCFELPVIIVRGNNVYGPRQYPEKMIPKFITSVMQGRKCTIAGNGLMSRNFVYVDDMCSALVCVLKRGKLDNIYNIGTHDEKTVLDVADMIVRQLEGNDVVTENYFEFIKDRYYNDFRYSIDSTKIRKLGWCPSLPFDEGILKTIQFYKNNPSLYPQDGPCPSHPQPTGHGGQGPGEDNAADDLVDKIL